MGLLESDDFQRFSLIFGFKDLDSEIQIFDILFTSTWDSWRSLDL